MADVNPYFPIFLSLLVASIIAVAVNGLSLFLGPSKRTKAKLEVYECGVPTVSSARQRLSVKFYLTAILFILFDIETVFLYLWAVAFEYLGWFGVAQVGIFLVILTAGFLYELKRGALNLD